MRDEGVITVYMDIERKEENKKKEEDKKKEIYRGRRGKEEGKVAGIIKRRENKDRGEKWTGEVRKKKKREEG